MVEKWFEIGGRRYWKKSMNTLTNCLGLVGATKLSHWAHMIRQAKMGTAGDMPQYLSR